MTCFLFVNVTVFATVWDVGVNCRFPLLLFGIIVVVSCRETSSSLMWFCRHLKWSFCVWFDLLYMEKLLFLCRDCYVIGYWNIVTVIVWWSVGWSWKYRETFHLFVFNARSHCSVPPQVWPRLCSRSVRFTRNKKFKKGSGKFCLSGLFNFNSWALFRKVTHRLWKSRIFCLVFLK